MMCLHGYKNILLVTIKLNGNRKGARESLGRLNASILKDIYSDKFFLCELPDEWRSGPVEALQGYIDGLSDEFVRTVINAIEKKCIDQVFIDGSNLGKLAKIIKKKYKNIRVITYYHNVEARFFWGSIKNFKTFKSVAVMMANYLAERNSVKYSDYRIMLNKRDSEMLRTLYGKSATHISPLTVPDTREMICQGVRSVYHENYALFVGGVFYANLLGIQWYVKNVAPYIDIKTVIVGRGFEAYKVELERFGNVTVVGEVDSVAPWYESASFVVAPIFDGSGMKTKVAEALMYGKKIVGTPEAFCGYESSLPIAGIVCETKDDFIKQISRLSETKKTCGDADLVREYERKYSMGAATKRFFELLS